MEMLLVLGVLVLAVAAVLGVHRRVQMAAWNRELDRAFGSVRELPRHRTL